MEYIRSWFLDILYVNVFAMLINSLMKNTTYEKYVRFFMGFVVFLSLIRPIIDFSQGNHMITSEQISEKIESYIESMEQKDMDLIEKGKLTERYEEVYENQMTALAKEEGLEVIECSVTVKEKNGKPSKCHLLLKKASKQQMEQFKEKLIQVYPIKADHIDIKVEESCM